MVTDGNSVPMGGLNNPGTRWVRAWFPIPRPPVPIAEYRWSEVGDAPTVTLGKPALPNTFIRSGREEWTVRPAEFTELSGNYRVRTYLNGIDITAYVQSLQWRYGDQRANRIGYVARPMDGTIILDDLEGRFGVFNHHPNIDPTPGARVEVWNGRFKLFEGWSAGVQTITPGTPEAYITAIPLYGELQLSLIHI